VPYFGVGCALDLTDEQVWWAGMMLGELKNPVPEDPRG
jgi:hypothetical protein